MGYVKWYTTVAEWVQSEVDLNREQFGKNCLFIRDALVILWR